VQLEAKKVFATFTPALREYLAKRGFDPLMGARPMARIIQDLIKKSLADEILFGRLADGGEVMVDIENEAVKLILETPILKKEPGRELESADAS